MKNNSGRLVATEGNSSGQTLPSASHRFDWSVAVLSIVWMIGVFIDGWAHQHGRADETFFTPWHALFYGGWAALGLFLLIAAFRNRRLGYPWLRSLPAGYGLSFVGVVILGIAGVSDLIWHEIFGLETDPEVLFSPTHLLLAFAVAISVSGPLRAAYQRMNDGQPSFTVLLPMLLSATATLSELTFLIQWGSPLTEPFSVAKVLARHPIEDPFAAVSIGVAGILLHAGVLMGVALLLIRRWSLPPGSFTLILTLNAIGMGLLHDEILLMPLGVLGGITADLLLWQLRPSHATPHLGRFEPTRSCCQWCTSPFTSSF